MYRPGLMAAVLDRDEHGNLIRKAGIMGVVYSGGKVRVRALESILLEKGYVEPAALDELIET